jgi:hypothetical protein
MKKTDRLKKISTTEKAKLSSQFPSHLSTQHNGDPIVINTSINTRSYGI